jgi:hypothetical protein
MNSSHLQAAGRTTLRLLPAAAWAAYAVGLIFRFWYIMVGHPLEDYYYSDMLMHGEKIIRLANIGFQMDELDFLNPIGYPIWSSLFYTSTHGWLGVKASQLVLCCLLPLLLWDLARKCHGRAAGWMTLTFASLHFHFIDYFAYLLSEGPFMFFTATGLWLLVKSSAINDSSWPKVTGTPGFFASGIALGIAGCMKVQIIIPLALMSISLFAFKRLRCHDAFTKIPGTSLAWVITGFMIPVMSLSIWASARSPHGPVLVSTYGPLNFLMGHYKEAGFTEFRTPGIYVGYGSPANYCRNMGPKVTVPIRPDDGKQALAIATKWIRENPVQASAATLSNLRDIAWCPGAWPTIATKFRRLTTTAEPLFYFFVWLPALIFCIRETRASLIAKNFAPQGWPWMLAITGLCMTAMIGMGEVRYRVPFDMFLILLAAQYYSGLAHKDLKGDAVRQHLKNEVPSKLIDRKSVVVLVTLAVFIVITRLALSHGGPEITPDSSILPPSNAWLSTLFQQLNIMLPESLPSMKMAASMAVPFLVWMAAWQTAGKRVALVVFLVAACHIHFIEIFRFETLEGLILITNLLAFCLLAGRNQRPMAAGLIAGITLILAPAAGLGIWIGAILARGKSLGRFTLALVTPWILVSTLQSAISGRLEAYPTNFVQSALMSLHWDKTSFAWHEKNPTTDEMSTTTIVKNPYSIIKNETSTATFGHSWKDTRENLRELFSLGKKRPEHIFTAPLISARNMFWGQYLWPANLTTRRDWLRIWEFVFHLVACVPPCLWLIHQFWMCRVRQRAYLMFLKGNLPMAVVFGAIVTGALFGGGVTHRVLFDYAFIIAGIKIGTDRLQ